MNIEPRIGHSPRPWRADPLGALDSEERADADEARCRPERHRKVAETDKDEAEGDEPGALLEAEDETDAGERQEREEE
jgi:hypothetical protein